MKKKQLEKQLREQERDNTGMRRRLACLESDLIRMWEFICHEEMRDEAIDYMEETAGTDLPFHFPAAVPKGICSACALDVQDRKQEAKRIPCALNTQTGITSRRI